MRCLIANNSEKSLIFKIEILLLLSFYLVTFFANLFTISFSSISLCVKIQCNFTLISNLNNLIILTYILRKIYCLNNFFDNIIILIEIILFIKIIIFKT